MRLRGSSVHNKVGQEERMQDGLTTPTQQVSDWLAGFGAALERSDFVTAQAMFDAECYWRDLVAFTWNIKTLEGKAAILAMLAARCFFWAASSGSAHVA